MRASFYFFLSLSLDPVCLLTVPSGSGRALSSGQWAHNSPLSVSMRDYTQKMKMILQWSNLERCPSAGHLGFVPQSRCDGELMHHLETAVFSNCISIFVTDIIRLFFFFFLFASEASSRVDGFRNLLCVFQFHSYWFPIRWKRQHHIEKAT